MTDGAEPVDEAKEDAKAPTEAAPVEGESTALATESAEDESAEARAPSDDAEANTNSEPEPAKPDAEPKPAKAASPPPSKDPALSFMVSVATFALALVVGEVAYRKSTLPAGVLVTETYPVKIADYTQHGGADVVIVGSSRIYHGAKAPLIAQLASTAMGKPITVYNMGIPSGDVPGYVLTVDDVLRKNQKKKPSLFVFGMSPIEWMCCPATSLPSSPRWVTSVRLHHAPALLASASDPEEAFTDLTVGLFQSYGARSHVLNQVLRDQPPPSWRGNPGQYGWVSFGWAVDPGTQNARAIGRAGGYAPYFFPPMHFDREGTHRYFMYAMERLESAGVKVAIIGTPQARQLDSNNVPTGYYPEYVKYLTEKAHEHGTEFVNFNDFPGLANGDFADGDHLVEMGAEKFSRLLTAHVIVPALRGEKPTHP